MTTLTKDEVISSLQAALEKQTGKAVSIEQSGSWYKIDGGKSVRFSELEAQLAQLTDSSPVPEKSAAAEKAPSKTKATTKAQAPAKPAVKTTSKNAQSTGLTPKQLWRAKLAQTAGKQTLPRGF